MSQVIFANQSTPDTPNSGNTSVYIDSTTGKLASKNSSGVVVPYGSTVVNGASTLGSDYQIVAADLTYADTGLSITLPSAGTYLITGTVRGVMQGSIVGGYIVAKLYNTTDAADVADSETLVIYAPNTAINQNSVAMTAHITITASKTIKLYAYRNGGSVYTFSHISSNAGGRTRLQYTKVA